MVEVDKSNYTAVDILAVVCTVENKFKTSDKLVSTALVNIHCLSITTIRLFLSVSAYLDLKTIKNKNIIY